MEAVSPVRLWRLYLLCDYGGCISCMTMEAVSPVRYIMETVSPVRVFRLHLLCDYGGCISCGIMEAVSPL